MWTGVWTRTCRGSTHRVSHRLRCEIHVSFIQILGKCSVCLQISTNWLTISHFLHRQKAEIVRSPMVPLAMPEKLRFNITPEVKRDIEKAKQNMNMYVNCRSWLLLLPQLWFCVTSSSLYFTRMVHDLDVKVLMFCHFGKNVPKQHKLSPDAFVQMAFQLAYFR